MKPLVRCSLTVVEQLKGLCPPCNCRYLSASAGQRSSVKGGDRRDDVRDRHSPSPSFDEFVALHRSAAMRSAVVVYPEECRGELSINVPSKNRLSLESCNSGQETQLVEFPSAADLQKFLDKVSKRFQARAVPVQNRIVQYSNNSRNGDPHFPKPQTLEFEKIDQVAVNKALLEADTVEDQIHELYERTRLPEIGLKVRFFVASAIEEVFRPFFPSAMCKPFGSSVNGFARRGCDLDVDIQLCSEPKLDTHGSKSDSQFYYICKQKPKETRHFVQNTLSTIGDLLDSFMPCYRDIQKILRARVPIIKFNHQIFGLSCDMTVENKSGYRAAKALWTLCELHPCVRPMLFFIRHWAKAVGVTHDSPGIWLSNFQLICLVVFFLQHRTPALLPPLDRLASIEKRQSAVPPARSVDVFHLVHEFFHFYSHLIDYRKYGLDMTSGNLVEKKDFSLLYIRNPFESGHNIARNLSSDEWLSTLLAMSTALRLCDKPDFPRRGRMSTGPHGGDWGLLTLCDPTLYPTSKKASAAASPVEDVSRSFSVDNVLSAESSVRRVAAAVAVSPAGVDSGSKIGTTMNSFQKAHVC